MLTCPSCHRSYADGTAACSADGTDLRFALGDKTRTMDHVPPEPPPALLELPEGMMVGEYRIDKKLGEGGFGTVYRALQPVIHKGVAIKVLNPRLASNREVVSRFVAEARAVNQIRHRNIVDIFSFGTLNDGRHYFVMDLLEGVTLREYLRQHGRMDAREAITILRPLARALDAAHAAGIAHRDLKPDNVFLVLEPDGHVFPKLIDFGLAKLLDHDVNDVDHRTLSGMPVGTPKYMSPEQCRGDRVDQRTDLYSFGVVVHELLTGSRPFEKGGMHDIFEQHGKAPPPAMSTVCADVPPALDAAVLHMLAKKPEDRPATVWGAIQALSHAIEGSMPPRSEPVKGTDPAIRERLREWKEAERIRLGGAETSALGGAEVQVRTSQARRTILFVGAVAGLAALVFAGASLRRGSLRGAGTEPALALRPSTAVPDAAIGAVADRAVRSSDVLIEVRSVPAAVDVFLGDQKVGTSAVPISVPRSDTRIKLSARAPGYNTAEIEVTPNQNGFVSVALSRALPPLASSPKKPVKPTPPELENPFK